MRGEIVHWELIGPDSAKLAAFYAELFGWNAKPATGMENYRVVDKSESGVGGAIGEGSPDLPSYEAIYVEVEDIDATLALAEANGGSTMMPRTVIPGTVIFAILRDPAGNIVGLVEPTTPD